MGKMSMGHDEITAMQFISARMSTESPGLDTGSSQAIDPSGCGGVFIQRFKGHGISRARRPIASRAIRRLSVQLS